LTKLCSAEVVASASKPRAHHHRCPQRHAPIRQFDTEHRALENVGMIGEAQLDLERVDPLARHLDQVVGAAAEEVKAVMIEQEAIASAPPAIKGFARSRRR
jgi:hypothetical protein